MAAAAVDSTNDVFINCPFDTAYSPIFRALLFVIYACSGEEQAAQALIDAAHAETAQHHQLHQLPLSENPTPEGDKPQEISPTAAGKTRTASG